ncbi:hypothetical protein GLYMA_02G276751v4 [Glycine max]|nr:hypothetical protein GLYMA_02G276751v4 [Glycine max]KAH1062418.1 hypothetical protein GYH30_005418 [Glycine max]
MSFVLKVIQALLIVIISIKCKEKSPVDAWILAILVL